MRGFYTAIRSPTTWIFLYCGLVDILPYFTASSIAGTRLPIISPSHTIWFFWLSFGMMQTVKSPIFPNWILTDAALTLKDVPPSIVSMLLKSNPHENGLLDRCKASCQIYWAVFSLLLITSIALRNKSVINYSLIVPVPISISFGYSHLSPN